MATGCELEVAEHTIDGKEVRVVSVIGFLDAHTFPELENKLNALIDDGVQYVVLDFGRLEYISSAGLGVLIGVAKKVREKSGDLKLVNLSEKILRIVTLLGFSRILQIFEEQAQALDAVKQDIGKGN